MHNITQKPEGQSKICKKCFVTKPISDFHKMKKGKFGVRNVCKPCFNSHQNSDPILIAARIKCRERNRDRDNARELAKYHANKEFLSVLRKQRRDNFKINHPEEYRQKQARLAKREYELYKDDVQYRLRKRIRGRVLSAIKKDCKTAPSLTLLGCSIPEFKLYLESKMTEGMCWEKFLSGEIHLDHIKPCYLFDLEQPEQQKDCFNYKNTQPLWASDNLRKGKSYQ